MITCTFDLYDCRIVIPSALCTFCMLLSSSPDTEIAGTSIPIDFRNTCNVMLSNPPTDTCASFPLSSICSTNSFARSSERFFLTAYGNPCMATIRARASLFCFFHSSSPLSGTGISSSSTLRKSNISCMFQRSPCTRYPGRRLAPFYVLLF